MSQFFLSNRWKYIVIFISTLQNVVCTRPILIYFDFTNFFFFRNRFLFLHLYIWRRYRIEVHIQYIALRLKRKQSINFSHHAHNKTQQWAKIWKKSCNPMYYYIVHNFCILIHRRRWKIWKKNQIKNPTKKIMNLINEEEEESFLKRKNSIGKENALKE